MEGNQLTVLERAAIALGTPEHEKKLRELVSQSASIVEIKNADARTQCHAAYMVLKNARVEIEKAGKTAREDATAFSKAVIEEQKRLVEITAAEEARLQGLRDVWDEAREAEKREKAEAEARRVAAIKARIEAFMLDAVTLASKSSAEIAAHADSVDQMVISIDEFAEFTGEAQAKQYQTVRWLLNRHAEAVAKEAEATRLEEERAELARLRAEQEERERIAAAERAEQEREARAEREAEEAKLRAERAAAEAKLRAEREAHEAEMQAQRDEIARQQAEIAAERRKQEAEAAAKRRAEEEAARKETERIRAEQDAKIAEQKRREREQFIEKGPTDDELVDVLASHYDVTVGDVIRWLEAFDVESFKSNFAI
ncbi:hypothetical protein [Caballeronia sp. NCTM5]|uniref:hypothetical protein n=1 Tax=Caballeronia sp. NCTM5 TaxID=2921755 RepID=UPI002028E74A|nr:hypothetical protein [Caballeronia sp. NCTM5]